MHQLLLFSCSVMSNILWPHGLQHANLPCPSPSPRACSNSSPLSQWCHPTISSSVVPFYSCIRSFSASVSFVMSHLLISGGQIIGASASASASVLLMHNQDWFPLGLTDLISLHSKGLSSLLQHHSSKASVLQHSAFFIVQRSHPYMTTRNTIVLETDLCPSDKGSSSQGYGFSCGQVWMWELDCEEGWVQKNWCFWTVVLEKTLESPLDCKESQQVHPKGNQSWIFIGRIDAETETPILWPPNVKN